jgi:ectoine hydroxylase-related dioxygenase (phytanoyl-CoA dioxygenase family)
MDTQFNYNESNKNDIKQFFKHNGYVVIEDFLDTDLADRLFNFLATRPEFWWESSTVNDESWNGTNEV